MEQRVRPPIGPALLEAQQKLVLLRQERRRERVALGLPLYTDANGRLLAPPPSPDSQPQPDESQPLASWPAHLGWHSAAYSQVIRQAHTPRPAATTPIQPIIRPATPAPGGWRPTPGDDLSTSDAVKLYPDIALALLKTSQAATGRVWLLLHHLDQDRCGQLTVAAVKKHLSSSDSPFRICSWRQLRNLLRQGEPTFWQMENGRLWLRSTARVAASLELPRLHCQPIALPVAALLQGMGATRAHLYASFHSSRNAPGATGQSPAKPIARATLQDICHVSRRSQRVYEQRANVQRHTNFAVATALPAAAEQERAWRHGPALFNFKDHHGKQGPAGKDYLAWQLPNHYVGPHQPTARGRQKCINQYLADLFKQGITGNGTVLAENGRQAQKRFYTLGAAAVKAYNRDPRQDRYWRNQQAPNGRYAIWFLLPDQSDRPVEASR